MFRIALALLIAASITACDAVENDNSIRVGVLLSLSGSLKDNGADMLNGMELAREEVNASSLLGDASIVFVIRDDESNPDLTQGQMAALIDEDEVAAVLGPHTSSSTRRITSTVTEKRVPALSPTSAAVGLGAESPYLFRSSLTVERLVPSGIEVSKRSLDYTRVATIVNASDAFGNSNNEQITGVLARHPDVSIVAAISYERPQTVNAVPDLSSELATLKAADPQAIFVSGLSQDRIGVLLQLHSADITDAPALVSLMSSYDVGQVIQQAPAAAEGAVAFHVWMAASEHAKSRAFMASYRTKHGTDPSDYAARGYAATHVLANALSNAESFEPEAIREALARTRNLDTIYGNFSFDRAGDAIYEAAVAQVKDGVFVIL